MGPKAKDEGPWARLEMSWGNGKVICRANDESQIYIRYMGKFIRGVGQANMLPS